MASIIKTNNITGFSGGAGSAPITLSGDTATLGSGVAMAANHAAVKTALNATGDADILACRAWADLNTQNADSSKILNHHNVASCVENSTGDYSITFENNMPHSNYTVLLTAQLITASWGTIHYDGSNKAVTGFRFYSRYNSNFYEWPCNFAVFC